MKKFACSEIPSIGVGKKEEVGRCFQRDWRKWLWRDKREEEEGEGSWKQEEQLVPRDDLWPVLEDTAFYLGHLSAIPGTYIVPGKNRLTWATLGLPRACHGMCLHIDTRNTNIRALTKCYILKTISARSRVWVTLWARRGFNWGLEKACLEGSGKFVLRVVQWGVQDQHLLYFGVSQPKKRFVYFVYTKQENIKALVLWFCEHDNHSFWMSM